MENNASTNKLILDITPLYNTYKATKNDINWNEAIEIMWDIWVYLEDFINETWVKPHNLFRDIYWKGEGTKNIEQKSYITREFMWRCYRVKKMFKNREDIKKELPNLVSLSAFRETMTFLDNPKYKFEWEDRKNLLALLNSNKPNTKVMEEIATLKKKYIWITNTRTQKLWELDDLKQSFVNLFNHIKLLIWKEYREIKEELDSNGLSWDDIKKISSNINALTNDSFRISAMDIDESVWEPWSSLIENINELAEEKTAKKRRRVRRVIDPIILSRIADMVNALSSEEYYNNYKN